jgi:hypothetical protein
MFTKNELKLAYGVAVVLLVVGVLSYTAFPAKKGQEPLRLMFTATAGKVLFDHHTHTSETGIGVSCYECHHHPAEDESALRACGDCHSPQPADNTANQVCLDCHDASEIEDAEVVARGDAFHTQCIDCHTQFEAGPVDCAACHVM